MENIFTDKVVLEILEDNHEDLENQDIFMRDQNILHLATEYSKGCLDVLLSEDMKVSRKKEYLRSLDGLQKTPLHLAASNATRECVITILNADVCTLEDVYAKDIDGNTPLHLSGQGCEETMYILLVTAKNNQKKIDIKNNKGRTPIFYAKTQKMLLLLHRFSERAVVDEHGHSILNRFLDINEDCAHMLLSTGITTNNREINDRDLLFIYDMDVFYEDKNGTNFKEERANFKDGEANREDGDHTIETKVLKQIQDSKRDELLAHPLTETFLYLRWTLISKFFYINIVFYLLYLISFTMLVLWTSRSKYVHHGNGTHVENSNTNQIVPFVKKMRFLWFPLYILTTTLTVLIFLREAFQALSERFDYFKSKENIIEMTLLISSLTYIFWTPWSEDATWEQFFAALAMFLAWMEVSVLLGRIPEIGMYTHMATHIIGKMGYFLFIYSTILFAFAIALHLLLIRDAGGVFENIWTTFLKVLVMMIGEYDFAGTFTYDVIVENQSIENESILGKAFPFVIQLLFLFLMFFVSVIIANLITGLTVSNIGELQKESGIRKLRKTLGSAESAEEVVEKIPAFFKKNDYWRTDVYSKIKNERNKLLICVQPNAKWSLKKRPGVYIHSEKHEVFIYDENRGTKGKKIEKIGIPSEIVLKTFDYIDEKQTLQKEISDYRKIMSELNDQGSYQEGKGWTKARSKKEMLQQSSISKHFAEEEVTISQHEFQKSAPG